MKTAIKIIASIIVTVGLLGFLIWWAGGVEEVKASYRGLNYSALFLAMLIYLVSYMLRAWRYSLILPDKGLSFWVLFRITVIHAMANKFIPFKIGEGAYVYLVRKEGVGTGGHGVASLIAVRLMDLTMMSSFLLIGFILTRINGLEAAIITAAGYSAIVFLVLTQTLFIGGRRLVNRIFPQLPFALDDPSFLKRTTSKIIVAVKEIQHLQNYFHVLLSSFLTWSTLFVCAIFLVRGLNYQFLISDMLVGAAFTTFAGALPVPGIGGFGPTESGWTIGFTLLGYPREAVIYTGIMFNAILSFFVAFMGIIALIVGARKAVGQKSE